MDAFYASVELRRRPELRDVPVVVGGGHRGVVLSASYSARDHGIHAGMPMLRARRLCPQVTVLTPDFEAYTAASRELFTVLDSITAVVEMASVDEAFCDITGTRRRLGMPRQVGELVRRRVAAELSLPCSVGIGPTRFVAKVASQQAKPAGLVEVHPHQVTDFLYPLPVERMWGVGEQTAARLRRLGLVTVADLAHTPRATMVRAFGPVHGTTLHRLARGIDPRPVVARPPERSISSQQTFGRDTDDPDVLCRELLRMTTHAATRMRRAGMMAGVVGINLRMADFSELNRSTTLITPSDVTVDLYRAAKELFDRLHLQRVRVRRVGVRLEALTPCEQTAWQPDLLTPDRGWRELEEAVDAAGAKFGHRAVHAAALLAGQRRNGPALSPAPSRA